MMNRLKPFLMSTLFIPFFILVLAMPLNASLNSAQTLLKDGRAYRRDFRDPDTWKDIGNKYEDPNYNAYPSLKNALEDFIAELGIFPDLPEALQGVAESVNEIIQGQTLLGNQRFIEATSGDKRYFTNIDDDEYLLGLRLDEQRAGLEEALDAFNQGLNDGFETLREFPHAFRSRGDVSPQVPKYVHFYDEVNWPSQPEQIILCEHAQLINGLNRKSLAAEELGRTLYRIADRSKNPDDKELATARFKQTAHHAYMGSIILSSCQDIEDFRENGGEQLKRRVANNRVYFENVMAGLTPDGTDSYDIPFIPYQKMSNIKNDAWTQVQSAINAAQIARVETRSYDQTLSALREELASQRARYLDPIEQISGFDPGDYDYLKTIDNRMQFVADIEDKITGMLHAYPTERNTEEFRQEYINGFGEIGPQVLSVIRAKIDTDMAYEELQKIPERIAIENDRAKKVARIIRDNLKEYMALDVARGLAQSFNRVTTASYRISGANGEFKEYTREGIRNPLLDDFKSVWEVGRMAAGAFGLAAKVKIEPKITKTTNFLTTYTYNPIPIKLMEIDSKERYISIMEQVEILNADSEALIRSLLLETGYKAKVLERSQAVFNQEMAILRSRIKKLNNLINGLWEDRETAEDLYYYDPSYEIATTEAQEYAADMQKRAIEKLYHYGKSLEYYWAEPFDQQINGWSCGGTKYVPSALDHYFTRINDIFWLRTSYECHYFWNALIEWDTLLRDDQCARWLQNQTNTIAPDISLKNDLLGLRDLPAAEKERIFAEFIRNHRMEGSGDIANPSLQFEFSITNKLLDDLIGDTWNRRISSISVRIIGEDGINEGYNILQIRLAQGGCVNVKNFFKEIVSYNIQEKQNPYGTPPFSFVAKARINLGFGTPVPGYPDEAEFTKDTLKGKPLAASKYTFTIDTGPAINKDIRFDRIKDIEFRVVCNHDQPPAFDQQSI